MNWGDISSFVVIGVLVVAWLFVNNAIVTSDNDSRPKINILELEKNVHDLINIERQKNSLPALDWNEKIATVARKHSQDMANRNYFSHDSPEGKDLIYRNAQEGFTCAIRIGNTIYGGAENIHQDNLYGSTTSTNGIITSHDWKSQEELANSIVNGWMNSPNHRENILRPIWKTQGIGIAIASNDKVYATEDFC